MPDSMKIGSNQYGLDEKQRTGKDTWSGGSREEKVERTITFR